MIGLGGNWKKSLDHLDLKIWNYFMSLSKWVLRIWEKLIFLLKKGKLAKLFEDVTFRANNIKSTSNEAKFDCKK